MSQPLAKVTGDLDAPRGPDVEYRISVDTRWFGSSMTVTLPRNLKCAQCQGGGCDACERAGAVSLREKTDAEKKIVVSLPALTDPSQDLCIRVPGEGGYAKQPELPRGHLMLILRPSQASETGLALVGPQAMTAEERKHLMKRSGIMAGALILLFLGMLKLSGWL